jgi:hypothetical protein
MARLLGPLVTLLKEPAVPSPSTATLSKISLESKTGTWEGIIMDMDETARRWMLKTVWAQFWRVADWYEIDDLIQDGLVCYWRVVRKYPDVKDKPHIMRLFQVALTNRIHTLSKRRTQQPDAPVASMLTDGQTEASFLDQNEIGEPPMVIAPAIRNIVSALEAKAEQLRKPFRRYSDGTRETTNERLCRLTGHDPSMIDLREELLLNLKG